MKSINPKINISIDNILIESNLFGQYNIDNIAAAICVGKYFNLGNEKSERLMDMVNLIEKEIGKKAKINYKSLQPGDMVETFADIDLSKEKLDYSPKINIKDGDKKLVFKYFYLRIKRGNVVACPI